MLNVEYCDIYITAQLWNRPYLEWTIPKTTNPRMTILRTDHT
jgi:hypothetical protein